MPDVEVGSVPFQEAIDFFRSKLRITTENFDDLQGQIHAKAFTIAGVTKSSMLADFHPLRS
jgi:uncharacterized protein with gpF-like domain